MTLTFPIADTALAALSASTFARTRSEASEHAGADVALVSEWFRPAGAEHASLRGLLEAGVGRGFVQVYEGPDGAPVFAVTLWRKGGGLAVPPAPSRAKVPANLEETDDLYFMKGRTRPRTRGARYADPRQLDLFSQPAAAVPDAPALKPRTRGKKT